MNKKGLEINWWFILFIIVMIGLIVLVAIMMHYQENPKDICKEDCKKFDTEFLKYKHVPWSNYECWCIKDGMPWEIP